MQDGVSGVSAEGVLCAGHYVRGPPMSSIYAHGYSAREGLREVR
jgi:hypothetical protein